MSDAHIVAWRRLSRQWLRWSSHSSGKMLAIAPVTGSRAEIVNVPGKESLAPVPRVEQDAAYAEVDNAATAAREDQT